MNILVVDDTKNIRILLQKCLESEGHAVTAAESGRAALEALRAMPFDLIFLDIKMPEFSGTEVLRVAREMGIRTPVIVITAYATVKNAVECTNLGAVAYLQKPFTADKIRTVLQEYETSRHAPAAKTDAPETFLSGARSALSGGAFDEAERLLREALARQPLEPEIYRLLAEACERRGKTAEAEQYRRICGVLR